MMSKGTFLCYEAKNFRADALERIAKVNSIVDNYQRQGLMLSVRQIYYQFVTKDWIANDDREYKKLASLISDGRIAGLISWTAIEDRNRQLQGLQTFSAPADVVRAARRSYRIDKWAGQQFRPEVWVEKAALEGVISSICNDLQVDFFACRGYNSQSEQWRAGQRFSRYIHDGQRPIVFHLGDHDPSGMNMTEDNRSRLSMFAGVPVLVQRLALNMPQVERYRPPPNPAKLTDSRAEKYIEEFGQSSWELDALEPTVIRDLIRDAVMKVRDESKWDAMLAREVDDIQTLDSMIEMMGGKRPEDDEEDE